MRLTRCALLIVAAVCGMNFVISLADEQPQPEPSKSEKQAETEPDDARKELLIGKVQFLGKTLRDRGVKAYEEMDKQVVLVTDSGELVPLVADWRGRAFYQDEKLRDRRVELVVRRKPNIPYAQVLMIYTFDEKQQRQYTDYWCDICSIPMYEIKECECCQGPIRLRFQNRPLPSYLQQELQREDTNTPITDKQSKKP